MISVTGNKSSFTLVELILVVVIITMFAAMAFPSLKSGLEYLEVSAFSRELRSFMDYLRERAVAEGEILVFSADNRLRKCYAFIRGRECALRSLTIPGFVKLQSEPEDIIFYPDASIDNFSLKVIGPRDTIFILAPDSSRTNVEINTQQ